MALFGMQYISGAGSSSTRANSIIDNLLNPRILSFRQITIFDEVGTLQSDGSTYKCTYGNWNPLFQTLVTKNGALLPTSGYSIMDYIEGKLTTATQAVGDVVNVTYNFDYFPVPVLVGFIQNALDIANTAPVGPPTQYTLDGSNDPPAHWNGLITDLAFAIAMERLLLDQTLWVGKLVYAIGDMESGDSGNIQSLVEALKHNAEDRAAKTMENPLFKVGQYLAPPTAFYYQAIRGFGGHNRIGQGKLRGWKPRTYFR